MKCDSNTWFEKEYDRCLEEIFEAYNNGVPTPEMLIKLKELKDHIDFYREADQILGEDD